MNTETLNLVIALALVSVVFLAFARLVRGVWWNVFGSILALASALTMAGIVVMEVIR